MLVFTERGIYARSWLGHRAFSDDPKPVHRLVYLSGLGYCVSATLLYRGFDASGTDIATCVIGFLCICSGVALLHHSRSEPSPGGIMRMLSTRNENEKKVESGEVSSAPGMGVYRYASTTRRHSRATRSSIHHAETPLLPTPVLAANTNTSSVTGNDDQLNSEDWKNQSPSDEKGMTKVQIKDEGSVTLRDPLVGATSVVKPRSFSVSTGSHRAQNHVGILHVHKLGLNRTDDDVSDRQALVEKH
ncbi:hypothetical protein EC973_007756 [Apophysomyces ossiformis]|uniref:Uncharacterized protein n=1 Tax=Apophysomyces ossiformis TaxID=679940 RepID=A0A8H7EVE2_9FUNG|nr:hypothetical protein EC973_007756 [Apophysomyces ossiformis]